MDVQFENQPPDLFRVLCPDGVIYEECDDVDIAFEYAEYADRFHDGARCDGPHRVFQATEWTEREPVYRLTEKAKKALR